MCPNKLWGVRCVLDTSVKCRVWVQVQPTKIELQIWNWNWSSILDHDLALDYNIKFNFGVFIKMIFSNKFVQTLVPFDNTNFVSYNGATGWKVCSLINHQLIHKLS